MSTGVPGDEASTLATGLSAGASSPGRHAAAHIAPRRMPSPYQHEARSTPMPQLLNSEHSTAYSSPGSSHWVQDQSGGEHHTSSFPYAYPNPELVGDSPYRSYSRGTPVSDRSDVSVGDSRYQGVSQWTRAQVANKSKAKKKKKGEEDSNTGIPPDQVSILSRESDTQQHDIERFVNRSIEARRKEVEGKNGYRPRPMNNFMLYRKAYQERAKQVSSQNNHQVVSVVVAASWKHEAPEVKEKFARYAQIEKDNHILAFPDYQFRPNKSQKAKKRKAGFDTDEETWTDFEDPNDPDWGRSSSKRLRTRQINQPLYSQDFGFHNDFGEPAYGLSYQREPRSTYGIGSSGKPPPVPVPVHDQDQDIYYGQMMGQSYPDPLQFDDSQWGHIGMPGEVAVPLPSQISGLPGAGDALLSSNDFGPTLGPYGATQPAQLDPMLATDNPVSGGAFTQKEFEDLNTVGLESGWEEHRLSLGAPVLPMAHHGEEATYDDEQFAQFLKS